jgi:hypothetical protein
MWWIVGAVMILGYIVVFALCKVSAEADRAMERAWRERGNK